MHDVGRDGETVEKTVIQRLSPENAWPASNIQTIALMWEENPTKTKTKVSKNTAEPASDDKKKSNPLIQCAKRKVYMHSWAAWCAVGYPVLGVN
jgi:hypothetical protein